MVEKDITQGSIITNIRSQKYPGKKCFGIIISARCDLAQGKVDCAHAISALPLLEWVQTAVFQTGLSLEIRAQLKIIEKWAQSVGQDIESLIELGPDKAKLNIDVSEESPERTNALGACTLWTQYLQYQDGTSAQDVAAFLNGAGKSTKTGLLSELLTGRLNNYCFIPENAYLDNQNMTNGLVADFKDILAFSSMEMQKMQRGEYDYLRILEKPDGAPLPTLNQRFYLETADDIVAIKYEINSPWIERLMQSFAYSFIRVGVDTINSKEATKISKCKLTGNNECLAWATEE